MLTSDNRCEWVHDEVHYKTETKQYPNGEKHYRSNASYQEALRRIMELEEEVEKELHGQCEISASAGRAWEKQEARISRLEQALAAILAIGFSRSRQAMKAREEARSLVSHILYQTEEVR